LEEGGYIPDKENPNQDKKMFHIFLYDNRQSLLRV